MKWNGIVAIVLLSLGMISCGGGGGGSGNGATTTNYNIYVQVSGLSGTGMVLQNNKGDNLTVNTNGKFAFATQLADGSDYNVTILTQPTNPAQVCSVQNDIGKIASADVTSVSVVCPVVDPVPGQNTTDYTLFLNYRVVKGVQGLELWRTDGTVNGTFVLANSTDKNVGLAYTNSTFYAGNIDNLHFTNNLVAYKNKYYFAAEGTTDPSALWVSDGVTVGIALHITANNSDNISNLSVFNGLLYFTQAGQLWESDGTPGNTAIVSNSISSVRNLVAFGNTLYFAGSKVAGSASLWSYDGGTVTEVKSFPAGIFNLTIFNGKLYFAGTDGSAGMAIWESSGTLLGTKAITNYFSTISSSPFAVTSTAFYFLADDGTSGVSPWRTDGTTTTLVKSLQPTVNNTVHDPMLYTAGDTLGFTAGDTTYVEFWKSDGSAVNTAQSLQVKQAGIAPWNMFVTPFNNQFYIRTNGFQLPSNYIVQNTDATVVGKAAPYFDPGSYCTTPVCTGSLDYYTLDMFVIKNTLYFLSQTEQNGVGGVWLWKTDGSSSGATPVKAICVNDATDSCING